MLEAILPLECKVCQEQTITDQTKIHMLLYSYLFNVFITFYHVTSIHSYNTGPLKYCTVQVRMLKVL